MGYFANTGSFINSSILAWVGSTSNSFTAAAAAAIYAFFSSSIFAIAAEATEASYFCFYSSEIFGRGGGAKDGGGNFIIDGRPFIPFIGGGGGGYGIPLFII